MWKDTELAYLAGIIDGEGFVSVRQQEERNRLSMQVGMITTDLPMIEWVHSRFGGKVYHRPPNQKHPNWKPKYEWRMSATLIDILIPEIRPYLIIKAHHADLLMNLRELYKVRTFHTVPPELHKQRMDIVDQIRSLNRGRKDRTGLPSPV